MYQDKVYLSRFRHKERTGEQAHYLRWFKENKFQPLGEDYPEVFEGGGDAVFSDPNTLWAGFGARSDKKVGSLFAINNHSRSTRKWPSWAISRS